MTDVLTPPAPVFSTATRTRFWQRRWVQITGTSIVALSIGSAAGAGSVNDKTAALKVASTKVAELRGSLGTANGQVSSLQQQLADANSAVSQAQKDAANAVDAAKKQVAAQDASTRAALKAQGAKLDARAADLTSQQRSFQRQVSSYNASAIGEGLYL